MHGGSHGLGFAPPEFFELIKIAGLRFHDMHNDIAQINEHPLAGSLALDAERLGGGFRGFFGHMARQRPDMPFGSAAGYDHEIGHAGFASHINYGDIVAFAVIEGVNHEFEKRINSHEIKNVGLA